MKVTFRDVSRGIVDARATLEFDDGLKVNEITIIRKYNKCTVEFPEKAYRGKDNKLHRINVITFVDDNKKLLWEMELLRKHEIWRKKNRRILVHEA